MWGIILFVFSVLSSNPRASSCPRHKKKMGSLGMSVARGTSDGTPAAPCGKGQVGGGQPLLTGCVLGTPALWIHTAWFEVPVPGTALAGNFGIRVCMHVPHGDLFLISKHLSHITFRQL